MGARTSIQWTGSTWNPYRGEKGRFFCTRVSEGCRNCYAASMNVRFGGADFAKGKDEIRLDPRALGQPSRWREPRMVFVNSMGDIFHEDAPADYIQSVFDAMFLAPRHTYQLLTKRAERMRDVLPHIRFPGGMKWQDAPPANIWIGVSIESPGELDRARALRDTPAAVRFISYEPALAEVSFREVFMAGPDPGRCECGHGHGFTRCPNYGGVAKTCHECACDRFRRAAGNGIHWLIVGGESGPRARTFDLEWARSAMKDCREAGVAYFTKQLGSKPYNKYDSRDFGNLRLMDSKGGDDSEWPEDLRVREFPSARPVEAAV